jgi:hypothetical protein
VKRGQVLEKLPLLGSCKKKTQSFVSSIQICSLVWYTRPCFFYGLAINYAFNEVAEFSGDTSGFGSIYCLILVSVDGPQHHGELP